MLNNNLLFTSNILIQILILKLSRFVDDISQKEISSESMIGPEHIAPIILKFIVQNKIGKSLLHPTKTFIGVLPYSIQKEHFNYNSKDRIDEIDKKRLLIS